MVRCIVILCLLFPIFLSAGTVRLVNNSPYDLRAVVRGSDGSYLAELVVKAQKETVWTDTYGQFGLYGGSNAAINQNVRSKTPYTVLWYCLDGGDYAVCDTVSTGALVMAQGCQGNRICQARKTERYPKEPEGHYLYQEPPPPLTQ